jgi:hypothetical protein
MFAVASPVVFLSDESGLLAVQGHVFALSKGFTLRQKKELRITLSNGGRLVLLANKQGLPRLRREVEKILNESEWKELSRSHLLFLYPNELSEKVSIQKMQLRTNTEQKDRIERREWQVLLVEIEDKKAVPQFLWNLNQFEEKEDRK